ncbi:hypothetical protein [Feifania hominis]|uniref:Uncharacterized protein n=1 Tax=Feifania hominis TaxID=2763660 RepID=A0A926HR01_9FIRM|nr:hypothetical protein [Feifania hominis]MBC8536897.1 hypothetical protein [Feifania hominis]
MKIIQIEPNKSGSRPPMQDWALRNLPQGYSFVPNGLDTDIFYSYNGFVNLTIEGDIVTAMTPNIEAWQAWKASLPEPKIEIDPVDKLRADVDYMMMKMEGI